MAFSRLQCATQPFPLLAIYHNRGALMSLYPRIRSSCITPGSNVWIVLENCIRQGRSSRWIISRSIAKIGFIGRESNGGGISCCLIFRKSNLFRGEKFQDCRSQGRMLRMDRLSVARVFIARSCSESFLQVSWTRGLLEAHKLQRFTTYLPAIREVRIEFRLQRQRLYYYGCLIIYLIWFNLFQLLLRSSATTSLP